MARRVLGRRWQVPLLLLVALATTLFVFSQADESKVRGRILSLLTAAAVRPGEDPAVRWVRLLRALEEGAVPSVLLRLPEFQGGLTGARAISDWAIDQTAQVSWLKLIPEHTEIRLGPQHSRAQAVARVTVSLMDSGVELRSSRNVRAALVKVEGVWRLETADIEPRSYEEPEPRP